MDDFGDTLNRIGSTLGWSVVGVIVLYAATRLFDFIDPVDYRAEIAEGNIAAAIKMAAFILGLAGIITAVIVT